LLVNLCNVRQDLLCKILIRENEVLPLGSCHKVKLARPIELVPKSDVFAGANVEDSNFHDSTP
jgi:hypothetical protein